MYSTSKANILSLPEMYSFFYCYSYCVGLSLYADMFNVTCNIYLSSIFIYQLDITNNFDNIFH